MAEYETAKRRLRWAGAVLVQSVKDLFQDSGPQWAAAIAYYSLLSIFPLLIAIVAVAAFFVEPDWAVAQVTDLLSRFTPQGSSQIEQAVNEALEARGSVSLLSFATLLWSGSRVFGTITKALNIAYDVDETYGFWKRTLIEIVMLATIGVVFLAALILPVALDLLTMFLDLLPAGQEFILLALRATAPPLLQLGAFFLIYRFVPRRPQHSRAALAGAAVATLLVTLAQPLFFNYVENIGRYNLVYGSLAIVVILVFWAWVVALIMLFGGELASHIQTMAIEGRSADEVDRRHKQRSPTSPKQTTVE